MGNGRRSETGTCDRVRDTNNSSDYPCARTEGDEFPRHRQAIFVANSVIHCDRYDFLFKFPDAGTEENLSQ